jgi:hypothetical protein
MRTLSLLVAAVGCTLCTGVPARASYLYDWSTSSGGTVTINSDHGDYQMKIADEPQRGPLSNGTDTTAAQLSIVPIHAGMTDTFHGTFNLSLVINDNGMTNNGKNGNPMPLVYHVSFTTTVYSDGATSTSAVALQPTSNMVTLGQDVFTVHLPKTGQWFVAPPTVGSVNTGSVGLSIDFKPGSGSGGNPTPEPSSLVLAALGLACAGATRWRRKSGVSVTVDLG